jgi:hypothetical protein
MTRRLLTFLLALMLGLPGVTAISAAALATASAQTEEPHMLDLPVLVAYCERDPGSKLQPGGGRFDPEQVMKDHGCQPAQDISVTVSSERGDEETDFFARCETDDDGLCRVEAPTDPERELLVAVHMSTVEPGFTRNEAVTPTVHFSEFTGVGIALLPDREVLGQKTDDLPERRTLAVKVEEGEDPASVLTQLSEGEVSIDEFPWLATNDEGWVSYDLGIFQSDTVDLMIDVEGEPEFACSDIDHGGSLKAKWIEGREGDFLRITLPDTDGDINCDVAIP